MLLFVCRFPGQVSQDSQLLTTIQRIDAKLDQNAVKIDAKLDQIAAKIDQDIQEIDQGIQETRELFKGSMQKIS